MKQTKHNEGPKARKNFERTMEELFRAPKTEPTKKLTKKRKRGKD
jgi:hypothetical protein